MLSLAALAVFDVVEDARLGREADGVGLVAASAGADVDELAMLAWRTGARSEAGPEEGATDWRLLIVEARGAGLGATTLEGRGLGFEGPATDDPAAGVVGVGATEGRGRGAAALGAAAG